MPKTFSPHNVKFPDPKKMEWVPDYMVPEKATRSTWLQKVIEPFIAKLKEHPGQWAVYARERKKGFSKRAIPDISDQLYTEIRNVHDKKSDTFTVYMRWVGEAIVEEESE